MTVAKVRLYPWWHLSLFLACFCTTFQGLPAQPQQSEQSPPRTIETGEFEDFDELNLDDLLDVRISIAAGKVQSLEEAPGIVSVITDEEIRRIGARTLADVMELVPGFEFWTTNLGRERISVRGFSETSTTNVLILFNGHRLNDEAFGGPTTFGLDIPLYNVKQIEVIRGPGSALFGSGAFSSVINIIPYTAENFRGTDFSVGGGSYGTQEYSMVTGHTLGDLGVSGSLQFADTEGPELFIPADAQTTLDEFLAPQGLPAASIAPGKTVGNSRTLDSTFSAIYKGFNFIGRVRTEDYGGFIGSNDVLGTRNDLENRKVFLNASHILPLSRNLTSRVKFGFSQNRIGQLDDVRPPGTMQLLEDDEVIVFPDGVIADTRITSRRFGGEANFDYVFTDSNVLTFGVGIERSSVINSERAVNLDPRTLLPAPSLQPWPPTIPEVGRTVSSFLAQDTWDPVPRISITTGVRFDHYSDFGSTLNPRAALVWRLPKSLYFKALYGRAFRAPIIFELVRQDRPGFGGNPSLDPAITNSLEFALGYRKRNLRLSFNYFANYIRDNIIRDGVVNGSLVNFPGLNVNGLEVEIKQSFGLDHSFFANYTFQRPTSIETFVGADNLEIPGGSRPGGVPFHLANVGATVGLGKYLSVTSTARLRGRRPRLALDFRPEELAGYGLLDLSVRMRNILDTVEITGTVSNVLDKDYFDPAPIGLFPGNYPRPGRNMFIRLNYRF